MIDNIVFSNSQNCLPFEVPSKNDSIHVCNFMFSILLLKVKFDTICSIIVGWWYIIIIGRNPYNYCGFFTIFNLITLKMLCFWGSDLFGVMMSASRQFNHILSENNQNVYKFINIWFVFISHFQMYRGGFFRLWRTHRGHDGGPIVRSVSSDLLESSSNNFDHLSKCSHFFGHYT